MASHHRDDAVEELLQKLRMRDVVVQQLKERCELMQEDYDHNYQLAQQQGVELQTLRVKSSVLEKQNRQFEARTAALQSKLREADGEVQRQTQSLHSTVESLRAQLLVGQTEHSTLTRKYAELEMQLATHRQELQQQSGRMSREAETIRREAMMESELRLSEKERLLRTREEQTLRDVQSVEHRCVELSSELGRVKELKETSDLRVEELTKTIARKEFLIQAAQEQLNETKKHHAQQLHKLELEAQGSAVLREQGDKSLATQVLTLQREIERRAHDNELLEQKLVALKHQHELEVRRRAEEKDELIRGLEDKCRAQADKLRATESRCTELEDEAERLRRRIGEGKKLQSTLVVNGSLLEDKVDDLQRALTTRDAELARLKSESERSASIADRKEKVADELRAEFERRAWQDRVNEEMTLEKKRAEWREHGASKLQHGAAAGGVGDFNTSLTMGGYATNVHANSFQQPSPIFAAPPQLYTPSQLNLSALAHEVKQQIQQQQQQAGLSGLPQCSHNGAGGGGGGGNGGAFLHELSILREQHQLEKVQLERRLQEATRSARRQRNRLAMLEAGDEDDDDKELTEVEHSRRVYGSSVTTPLRRTQPPPHRGNGDAASTPQAAADKGNLNNSRDASMSIHRDDQENAQQQGANKQQQQRAASIGLPPRAAGAPGPSATSRVEELQRQLAASPVSRPI